MIRPPDRLPTPAFRADLVARVRREIAEGRYETPEKLDAALARLLEDLEDRPPRPGPIGPRP
jgi:hypothetical protein